MSFPIIPAGMWSGQGSTGAPNANAVGTTSANIGSPATSNLANAYDGDPNTYADMQNGGVSYSYTDAIGTKYQQEILYTHSPASGAVASSFVNITFKVRAVYSVKGVFPPSLALTAGASGNYSDATPVNSSSNPTYIVSMTASDIQAAGGLADGIFDGTVQIVFDGLSGSKTIDVNSLSISIKWLFTKEFSNGTFFTGSLDARIYDISYIYL